MEPSWSSVECIGILERFSLLGRQPAFDFLHVFGRRQAFRPDTPIEQRVAYGLVVGDVLPRDRGPGAHSVCSRVVDGDLGGEVLGLENDGGRKIGERPALGDLPLCFHLAGGLAEKCLIALAADDGEVFVAAGLLINDGGKLFLRAGEFPAGGNAFRLQYALLDAVRLCASAWQSRSVRKRSRVCLGRRSVPKGNTRSGSASRRRPRAGARAKLDHFVDVNKMVTTSCPETSQAVFALETTPAKFAIRHIRAGAADRGQASSPRRIRSAGRDLRNWL